jgi:hypothetical protein
MAFAPMQAQGARGIAIGRRLNIFSNIQAPVSNEDLKKFIDDTVPVMKEHLEMAKKMQGAK